ncbi:MAG: PAS domain S-box protein [Chloroflexota bacterium]|nr:MAG: PAS domain S-box protein [Chloroflexota bacterium]
MPARENREANEIEPLLSAPAEQQARMLDEVLSASADHIYVYDRAGRYIYVSLAGARALGFERTEMVGKTWRELGFPAEIMESFDVQREQVFATSQPVVGITGFPTTCGDRDYEYILTPIHSVDGSIVAVVCASRDITERKRAGEERERLLRETETQRRLFQMVIDNAPAGIAVLDGREFRVKWCNQVYREFLEEPYRGMDLTGLRLQEFIPRAEENGLADIFRQVAATGQPHIDPEWKGTGFARGITYWNWVLLPLAPEGGGIPDLMVLAIEITEQVVSRKKIEEIAEIAQQRAAQLETILDNMVDAVYVCDAKGRVILLNKAVSRLLGARSAEDLRGSFQRLLERFKLRHIDGRPMEIEELPQSRALMGETVIQDDEILSNLTTRRDVYIRVSASPIRDERGAVIGAVSVVRDVTELIELDQLKDQFILVAAHELKTPVTGIKGFAQLLLQREHEGISPLGLKALQAIDRQANRITGLVNDLLDISQLQTGQLELAIESIDLPALVQEVIDRIALTTARHRIQVIQAEPVVVQGDRVRLDEVVANLLDNAIRYSPKGGEIDVAIARTEHEAVVSVADQGVGIPIDKQARIFQRFYRAHTGTPYDYGGMGVDLYISKEIITRHGGRLWFHSKEGEGSTFSLALPLAQ